MSSRSERSPARARRRRAIENSVTKNVRKLNATLEKRRPNSGDIAELAKHLVTRLERTLRWADQRQLEISFGIKGTSGRPATGLSRQKSSDGPGRKKRRSVKDERDLLRELDSLKRGYAANCLPPLDRQDTASLVRGESLSDVAAIKLLLLRQVTHRFKRQGLPEVEARVKARAEVSGLAPRIRSYQVLVSRLRSRHGKDDV